MIGRQIKLQIIKPSGRDKFVTGWWWWKGLALLVGDNVRFSVASDDTSYVLTNLYGRGVRGITPASSLRQTISKANRRMIVRHKRDGENHILCNVVYGHYKLGEYDMVKKKEAEKW